jgi:hypothetical protein
MPADGDDARGSGSRLEVKVDAAGEIRDGDFRGGLVGRKERYRGIELIGARAGKNLYASGFRQNMKIEPVYVRPDQFAGGVLDSGDNNRAEMRQNRRND